MKDDHNSGPLGGTKVLEFEGLGPVPFAGMMLADLGADVITVQRVPSSVSADRPRSVMSRGRRTIALDLKQSEAVDLALELVVDVDVVMEGFRPGVMERLGLGPSRCHGLNPTLVYARMTGFGQEGPLSSAPGHDINFIALTGVLAAMGPSGTPPSPPLNLIGDYGGGGMLLAVGVLAGLLHSRATGTGQVVDAAMVDGAATLMASAFAAPEREGPRGTNTLDGGAPFYNAYETADGGYVAVGAVEPHFFESLVAGLGLTTTELPHQWDREGWPETKRLFAGIFSTKTRQEWCDLLEGTSACLSPVLDVDEVAEHPHARARSLITNHQGTPQPAPSPRFGLTPGAITRPPPRPGAHTAEILSEIGVSAQRLKKLRHAGVIA